MSEKPFLPFYSPLAAVKAWLRKRAGADPAKVRVIEAPAPGILQDLRLAVQWAEEAEKFIRSPYHDIFVEWLELRASKLYEEFEKGAFEKETYFKAAGLIKDVAEHPFQLIRSGQVAANQIREWDQHGLTGQVADADAFHSKGEDHAGPV